MESLEHACSVNDRPALRARAIAEITLLIILILTAEWVIPAFGGRKGVGMIPVAAALLVGLLAHCARGESARDIGFTRRNFGCVLKMLLPWMIAASCILFLLGWFQGSLHRNWPASWGKFALNLLWLLLWGLMQQYGAQAIINRRAQEIWGKGLYSISVVAAAFSLLHFPNIYLMTATLAGGILWAAIYQKAPNLYALAFSHCVMTCVLSSTVSMTALHGLRVGYNYL